MNSPSEPIIDLILKVMKDRSINTATLAKKIGIEKKILKSILRGNQPLTVDQLMLISANIELSEEYLSQLNFFSNETKEVSTSDVREEPKEWEPDPQGIHALQLIQLGFALGIDILFSAQTDILHGLGIPKQVLQQPQFQPKIPIRLDASFHQYYNPRYCEDGLEIKLSFDAVYDCFFPWHSIDRVSFFVEEEAPTQPPQKEEAPFLRIIK